MEPTPEKPAQPAPAPAPEPIGWTQTGIRTAVISGVFCLVILALLVINHFQGKAADPLDNKQLAGLKAALVKTPLDEKLKQEIRVLDFELRKKHFHHVALGNYGAWLLFGGVVVFLISIKPATYRKKLPKPEKRTAAAYTLELALTRYSVGALGVLVAGTAIALSNKATTNLTPAKPEAAAKSGSNAPAVAAAAALPPFPTVEELKRNWPRFRGPFGTGISAYTNVPVKWDAATGEGILWKVETPISGPSSPVVWGDRIFLSGANAIKREVYCFDTSGKLLWQKPVDPKRESNETPTVMEDSGGYGPSTPYTDGRRVYAIYANGDVAAFDFAGNPVWSRNLGKPDNAYGHATSLEMFQDKLIVQLDQGDSAKANKSRVLALNAATGETAWQTDPRPVPNSWATPIMINNGQRDMLIACGNPWVMAYDPTNGKEIWRAKAMSGEVLPSPVYFGGIVYTAIDGEKLNAIRVDGTNDVTKTHIAWSAEEGLPDIVGPLCDGERVYLVNSGGTMTCYDAKLGKKLWDKDCSVAFKGSTTVVGDKIYAIGEDGAGIVIQAGNEFKEIARSKLGEEVLSTPAFVNGRIYVRGKKNLFCIGTKGA